MAKSNKMTVGKLIKLLEKLPKRATVGLVIKAPYNTPIILASAHMCSDYQGIEVVRCQDEKQVVIELRANMLVKG